MDKATITLYTSVTGCRNC